jgi:hypothetical protein
MSTQPQAPARHPGFHRRRSLAKWDAQERRLERLNQESWES